MGILRLFSKQSPERNYRKIEDLSILSHPSNFSRIIDKEQFIFQQIQGVPTLLFPLQLFFSIGFYVSHENLSFSPTHYHLTIFISSALLFFAKILPCSRMIFKITFPIITKKDMKFLHTSDWHLGRTLYGRKRYEEFIAFLDWLTDFIEDKQIDALLIAGDIFDTGTPSNKAQELYYRFLCTIGQSKTCQHVVIIAGNHDSPSFLDAPKALLKTLHVHVVGTKQEHPEDEVITLCDPHTGIEKAIICAIPYLRDRDIRLTESGESIEDKHHKLIVGIKEHYETVAQIAEQKRILATSHNIPIIAMGHLFTAGGTTIDGDGVRELYVGSLVHVQANTFPTCIDYLALGHLHVPQKVGGMEHLRYSGSPIPMGFGEAGQQKSVVVVTFSEEKAPTSPATIELHNIPTFQRLERINGTIEEIITAIDGLKNCLESIWIEVEYTGSAYISGLREQIEATTENSQLEIRRIKNRQVQNKIMGNIHQQETLDELSVYDVFERCLSSCAVKETEQEELKMSYQEIIRDMQEDDSNRS